MLKCILGVNVPVEGLVLLSEAGEWFDYRGIVGDESSVEVGEAKEALDLRDISWLRPFDDGLDFIRVHLDSFRSDDESEELN